MNCSAQAKSGAPCKAKAGPDGFCVFHRKGAEPVEPETFTSGDTTTLPPDPSPEPVVLSQPERQGMRLWEGRKNMRTQVGQRRVKMLRPICNPAKMRALGLHEGKACQDKQNLVPQWWTKCPHDPYYSLAERKEKRRRFEDILDEQGNRTGQQRLVGEEEIVWYEKVPNLVQVSVGVRYNWAIGVQRARASKGFILPEEHPTDPLFPYCQFLDCWAQRPKHRQEQFGDFCEEWQLRLCAADAMGKTLEIGAPDLPQSPEKRFRQLQEVAV